MYQPELGRFMQPDPKQFAAGEWSELGSRDMDCIGRMVMRPRERERTSHYNLYRYCHNDPVNHSDPTGLITIVIPGFGPQHWGSNRTFVENMKKLFRDAKQFGRTQAEQGHALAAVKDAIARGDKTVNIAGYSRGVVAGTQLASRLGKEGIAVNNFLAIDPVTVTGNNGSIAVPSNVQHAQNFFQNGARLGVFDFPGTPLRPAANVVNVAIPDGVRNGYDVRHENMPAIVTGQ
jgi:RHS repeat-associated protein